MIRMTIEVNQIYNEDGEFTVVVSSKTDVQNESKMEIGWMAGLQEVLKKSMNERISNEPGAYKKGILAEGDAAMKMMDGFREKLNRNPNMNRRWEGKNE